MANGLIFVGMCFFFLSRYGIKEKFNQFVNAFEQRPHTQKGFELFFSSQQNAFLIGFDVHQQNLLPVLYYGLVETRHYYSHKFTDKFYIVRRLLFIFFSLD